MKQNKTVKCLCCCCEGSSLWKGEVQTDPRRSSVNPNRVREGEHKGGGKVRRERVLLREIRLLSARKMIPVCPHQVETAQRDTFGFLFFSFFFFFSDEHLPVEPGQVLYLLILNSPAQFSSSSSFLEVKHPLLGTWQNIQNVLMFTRKNRSRLYLCSPIN